MIEKYLDEKYAPSNVADECGIPATTINGLADQIADVAFNQSISINQTWTDFRGKKCNRLKQIEYLISKNLISNDLKKKRV